ncbi:unnamed protein product [Camellia sinensis]
MYWDVGNNNHVKLSLAKADFPRNASTFLAKNLPEDSAMAKTLLTFLIEYYSTVYEDLVQQLGSATALDHLSKSLFVVVIGSNDILGYFKSGSDLPKKITQQQYVDLMVMTLKDVLKRMHNFGSRKFVVAGIGAVGCCPSQRNQNKTSEECNEETNY